MIMDIMKKIPFLLGGALLIIGAGIFAWRHFHDHVDANRLVLYGNVDIRQVQLAFKASERIATMPAFEGDKVEKGELLATLDSSRFRENVELRKAELAAQQEVVKRLVSGSRIEEIDKARADFDAAKIDAGNAMRNAERLKRLASRHFVSEQQADNAATAANAAKARMNAAGEVLKLALKGPRQEDIEAAKSMLDADKAALALASLDLADARLYAPSNGIIEDRILEPGDMASPAKPVFTLALTNPIWVRAYVSESDLGKLKLGMAAEVSTDSYPGKSYRGWVGYISPSAEFTPKSVETPELRTSLSYQVRIFVCNSENELRLGMPATASISLLDPIKAAPCRTI